MSTTVETTTPRNRLSGTVELPRRWLWLFRLFRKYSHRYLRKHFHGVRLSRSSHQLSSAEGPLLIVLNHPAWWDPMICMVLSGLIPERDHFGAIDVEAVKQYGFFKKLGFVEVDTQSLRGAAEFIRTGTTILSGPNRVYWITAQGRFTDVRERPLALQAGVGHLASRMTHGTVVPIAFEYCFWNERTPEALVRVGKPLHVDEHTGISGKEWTSIIEQSLTRALDGLNAEAISRDPTLFTDLVSGETGVGGIYDLWRRLKMWIRGRKFESSHEAAARGKPQ
jgi:1-acyl-sn-glycerol-3-phosphate acyltransferase